MSSNQDYRQRHLQRAVGDDGQAHVERRRDGDWTYHVVCLAGCTAGDGAPWSTRDAYPASENWSYAEALRGWQAHVVAKHGRG